MDASDGGIANRAWSEGALRAKSSGFPHGSRRWVHGSIPLTAKTIEALGNKGDLWSTTISYSLADITAANLKQYDAIFLDSTTACFLDDENEAATAARRKAFMDFVRGGKGVASIHAATDFGITDWCRRGRLPLPRTHAAYARCEVQLAQGDSNGDKKISRQNWSCSQRQLVRQT